MLERIAFSDGTIARFGEIWIVNPMPVGGIPDDQLRAVDLAAGEEKAGPGGETIREMISKTYKCTSRAEEDLYLRRFIAS